MNTRNLTYKLKQMKKFKHKQTGEIATYNDGVLKSSGFCVEIGVEPSDKYWEEIKEVVQKEYEILSFIDKPNTGRNYRKYTSNLFYSDDSAKLWYESELLKDEDVKIHSVKRLSDGEIFTIGDKIDFNCMGVAVLKEIHISTALCDKGKNILCFVPESSYLGKWWNINELIKAKQPLFKTEDGVDIHVNQYSYGVYLPITYTHLTMQMTHYVYI